MRTAARILLLLLLSCTVALADQRADELAAKVDKRYNSITSMQADFSSSYEGAGMARRESGKLVLMKPGRMRWEYEKPRTKLFVTDGKTAYFYVPDDKQVRKAPLKKLDDLRSPMAFLLGRSNLRKQLDGLTLANDLQPSESANLMLRGVPKAMADRVAEVVLEVTPEGEIRRIQIVEHDGSRSEFRFENVKYNSAVTPGQFRFTPPAGVEVLEGNEVQP